jgi:hypothetical protein
MKLRQLLKAHFDTNGVTPMGRGVTDYILMPKLLNVYLEELHKCHEFAGSNISIIEEIVTGKPKKILQGHDEDGIPMYGMEFETSTPEGETIITHKLSSTTKFAPNVKLFSISLTPELFDPNDVFQTKLHTTWIAPTVYDPETLAPTKRLILTFSPEQAQQQALTILKKEIREVEKDEEKPEFTVSANKVEKQEEQIKEHVDEAKDVMEVIKQDELKEKINEQEEKYIQTLVELVQSCLRNSNDHKMPCKRAILVRATANSFVNNEAQVINPADIFVQLK